MSRRLPGEPEVLQAGPLFPLAQIPMIPDAAHASRTSSMSGSSVGEEEPHELLTMCGRFDTSGFRPSASVGASIHWPDATRSASVQVAQPLAAIQRTPGATPIWLPSPSSPAIVPIVCVPWPLLSQGAPSHLPEASNQL
ncbi:hypothetical protein LUW74_28900 [Actinomadura madurae]|nr:hypothetical protein [Actinomadura madurae]URN06942.1 hypothetical protein LUW74_28900 [Actinomadura madurae]